MEGIEDVDTNAILWQCGDQNELVTETFSSARLWAGLDRLKRVLPLPMPCASDHHFHKLSATSRRTALYYNLIIQLIESFIT